jgi:hypothetical protein
VYQYAASLRGFLYPADSSWHVMLLVNFDRYF